MADYDKPGGAGDPTKKINDVVNKKLEDYGKPGGAGDSTQKIKDIVKQMLDAYYAPGGDGTSQEVKGVQAILDAYGITSLGIGTYFNNYPHQIAQIIFVVTSVRDCIVVNFSLLATMHIISTLRVIVENVKRVKEVVCQTGWTGPEYAFCLLFVCRDIFPLLT